MFKRIKEDIQTIFNEDPAAKNIIEVILCYPRLHAIWLHRIAHWFYKKKMFTAARIISHINRHFTNIEIHPGAKIGRRVFIDHGTGVVIGETAVIGDDVLMFQGAVLGGTSFKKEKRHPTVGSHVIIGAGAIVLGSVIIGNYARIGAGSVVISNIPPNATAVGIPAKIGRRFSSEEITILEHGKLPDPIAEAIRFVLKEQGNLEKRIKKLESMEGITSHIDMRIEKRKKEIEEAFWISKNGTFYKGEGI